MDKVPDNEEFDFLQQYQIEQGIKNGIDVSAYAKPEFDFLQMEQIRIGLETGIDVTKYADKKYDHLIMKELRLGINANIDLFPALEFIDDGLVLKEIRIALLDHIDLIEYAKQGYDADQLEEIRICLENKVDIANELSPDLYAPQIKEIRLGLEAGVDVSLYNTGEYTWFQMRELRLGLEEHLEISYYARPLLTWKQMQEIRLGLEQNLDVSSYSSLSFTAHDMKKKRLDLLNKPASSPDQIKNKDFEEEDIESESSKDNYTVTISDDGMQATLELVPPDGGKDFRFTQLLSILSRNGVKQGIDKPALQKMIFEHIYFVPTVVATGQPAVNGNDGYYEFFFQQDVSSSPKILDDGSVDYYDTKVFEWVEKDTVLATYTPATLGKYGYRVNGTLLTPIRGKELPPLKGRGFYLSEDKHSYISAMAGKVAMIDTNTIEVSKMYLVDGDVDVSTGNIDFNGDLHIEGDVLAGFTISATGSICIDGHVEKADITCGGDLIIKKGVQGGGGAHFIVGGDLKGTFFETTNLVVGGDVEANYILNCTVDCSGCVVIKGQRGSIIGGKTRASSGITSQTVGNISETPTYLEAGVTKELTDQYTSLCSQISKVYGELQSIQKGIDDIDKQPTLTDKIIEFRRKLGIACEMKTNEFESLKDNRREFLEKMENAKQSSVLVNGRIFPGSQIWINSSKYSVDTEIARVRFMNDSGQVKLYQF